MENDNGQLCSIFTTLPEAIGDHFGATSGIPSLKNLDQKPTSSGDGDGIPIEIEQAGLSQSDDDGFGAIEAATETGTVIKNEANGSNDADDSNEAEDVEMSDGEEAVTEVSSLAEMIELVETAPEPDDVVMSSPIEPIAKQAATTKSIAKKNERATKAPKKTLAKKALKKLPVKKVRKLASGKNYKKVPVTKSPKKNAVSPKKPVKRLVKQTSSSSQNSKKDRSYNLRPRR